MKHALKSNWWLISSASAGTSRKLTNNISDKRTPITSTAGNFSTLALF